MREPTSTFCSSVTCEKTVQPQDCDGAVEVISGLIEKDKLAHGALARHTAHLLLEAAHPGSGGIHGQALGVVIAQEVEDDRIVVEQSAEQL